MSPVPLTVIGGFLGAGKSSLVNHLLRRADIRYAVLVNDFGAINIDADLIYSRDRRTLRLTNGCLCCSLNAGLYDAVASLLDGPRDFDRILVEASGVADPWKIAEIAFVEPELSLDAVVVVADAGRLADQWRDRLIGDTVRRQVAKADFLLLNKTDIASPSARAMAETLLRAARPGIRIIPTRQGRVPPTVLLSDRDTADDVPPAAVPGHSNEDRHEQIFHRWQYLRRNGVFDPAALASALAALPSELLRLKGFCRLQGSPGCQLLQMVGSRWTVEHRAERPSSEPGICLVGIGQTDLRGLDVYLDRALLPQ